LQKRIGELETFRNLLDKVTDGILMIQLPASRIVDANEAACKYWVDAGLLFAANLPQLFPPVEAALQQLGRTAEAAGRRQDFSTEFRRWMARGCRLTLRLISRCWERRSLPSRFARYFGTKTDECDVAACQHA
jgi:PAS domain-containing protein